MGIYYMYVNITKQQYFDPGNLEFNNKESGLFLECIVSSLAMLLVDPLETDRLAEICGA
jgi:hypothetical protein